MYQYERNSRVYMKGDGDRKSALSSSRPASRSPLQELNKSGSHHRSSHAIQQSNGDCNGLTTHHSQTKSLKDAQQRAISTEMGELTAPGETKTKTQMARAFQESQELYKSADSKAGLQTVKTRRVVKKTTTITRGENEKAMDEDACRRIDEYKDHACKLLKWIKEATHKMEDRKFPKSAAELKRLREETERFRSEEIPPKHSEKQRLVNMWPEICKMASELGIELDPEVSADNIECQWDRLMKALRDRLKAIDDELNHADRLKSLLAKLLNDIKKAHARLDGVERDLNEEERRVAAIETLEDAERFSPQVFQRLSEELADIGIKIDGIKRLAEDFISEAGRSHPDSVMVREKVAELDARYKKLLARLDNLHDQYDRVIKRLRELEDMRRAQARKEAEAKLRLKLDAMKRELDELEHRIDNMGPVSKDLATLQRQLAELHEFEQDLNRARHNLNDLIKLAEGMIKEDLIEDPVSLRAELQALKDQLARIEEKAARRLREFEDALRRAEAQKAAEAELNLKLDNIQRELDELERRLDSMAPVAKDVATLKRQLAEMQDFERDMAKTKRNLGDVVKLADDLIRQDLLSDPALVRTKISALKEQMARIEDKAGRRMRAIQDALKRAEAQKAAEAEMTMKLDAIKRELNELERRIDNMEPVAKDLATLKKQLAEMQDFERDMAKTKRNLGEVVRLADDLIRQDLISDPASLRANINGLKEQMARIEDKAARRMRAIQDALKKAEAQKAAEAKYRLRLDDMKRELDELERQLDNMAPVAKDLTALQEQLNEINDFLQKLKNTGRNLTDLLKTGEDLIRDDMIAEPAVLRADMKELKDQFARIEDKANKRLREIQDAMSRVAATDAIQDVAKWLGRARKVLVEEENVHGDLDTVNALIEQHKSFTEELMARQTSIADIQRMEQELTRTSPHNGAAIKEELATLMNQWNEVKKLTSDKATKLDEALRVAEQLHHSVHGLLELLADAETRLRQSATMPEDDSSARQEIAEHENMMRVMAAQSGTKDQTLKLARDILAKCHPDAEPVINHWINILQTRWDEIDAWAKQRAQRLADHLRTLLELLELVGELINWLSRHETRLLSEEVEPLPEDAGQLDKLIDQHSGFMDELRKREPQVDRVVKVFASKASAATSKVILTTTTTKPRTPDGGPQVAIASSKSPLLSGRLSAGPRSTTPTRTSYATYRDEYPEVRQPQARAMLDKWRSVWQLSLDKMQRLKDRTEHAKGLERGEYAEMGDGEKPTSDEEMIQEEVQRQMAKYACSKTYKIYHVGDGRYRFGESQKLRQVKVVRGSVMVRSGGGWEPLTTFLQKNVPC